MPNFIKVNSDSIVKESNGKVFDTIKAIKNIGHLMFSGSEAYSISF
jgi:hypothetical protein